jgi:nucleotide-binding universal stress UspA family protein
MKTVLVPIDLSTTTDSVCEAAARLAAGLGAKLILLHIVQPPVITSDYGIAIENIEEIVAVSEKTAPSNSPASRQSIKTEPHAEIVQLTGAPVPLIIEEAKKRAADYIVMGSHGHTAFYDLLVGTTTHGVLKKAPCPVLVVPKAKQAK